MRIPVKQRSAFVHVEKRIHNIAAFYERHNVDKFHFNFGMQRIERELMTYSVLMSFGGKSLVIYLDDEDHYEAGIDSALKTIYNLLINQKEKPEWSDFLKQLEEHYSNG